MIILRFAYDMHQNSDPTVEVPIVVRVAFATLEPRSVFPLDLQRTDIGPLTVLQQFRTHSRI